MIYENLYEVTTGYGVRHEYRAQHPYDGTDYRLKLSSTANPEVLGPLYLNFDEYWQTLQGRKDINISLVSDGPFPYLRYTSETIERCHYDQWGQKICDPNTFEYSAPLWILPDGYTDIVHWKNRDTNVLTDKTSNFAEFMACVERQTRR